MKMSGRIYSESFKENAVKQLTMPGSPGISAIATKIGIPCSTFFGWRKKYANNTSMKKSKDSLIFNSGLNLKKDEWSAERKLSDPLYTVPSQKLITNQSISLTSSLIWPVDKMPRLNF